MSVFFIFWDGVGYGTNDPERNPFMAAPLPVFRKLFDGQMPTLSLKRISNGAVSVSPVNTTLGVAGLPQSGTGQAALMTGMNAARIVGKHFGPYPYSSLVPIIREKNLFTQLASIGRSSYFANGYPQKYFDHIFGPKGRVPVIALSYLSSGGRLNTHEDIIARRAISADISGTRWKELGHPDVSPTDPLEAGRLFGSFGRQYDLVFFEYFITDHAGHSRDMAMAVEVLRRMDGFIGGLLEIFDPESDIIVMISDHGNIEDLSIKSHTRNPVPLIVIGKRHAAFAAGIKQLTDVAPAVLEYFTKRE